MCSQISTVENPKALSTLHNEAHMELPISMKKKSGFGHFLALELQTTTAHTQTTPVEDTDVATRN